MLDRRARAAWISSAAPGTAVERVGNALTEGLRESEDFRKAYFNKASGALEEIGADGTAVPVARGLTRLGKTAFLFSLAARLPRYGACFVDNQNLSFLAPPNACIFVHDLFYLTHPNSFAERAQAWLQYRNLRRYEAAMVNSEYTKRVLAAHGMPPERIHVFPLDYDRRVFGPGPGPVDKAALRRRIGLPEGARMLFHVSSGEKRKNFPGILAAFARLAEEAPDLFLVKAGRDLKSGNTPRAEAEAAALGLAGRVRFLGPVDDGLLADLYRAADCFVFPSLAEGFGLPVLEAQGCGCPVVTSNATSLPEVAGPLSATVDPADPAAIAAAIRAFLADPGLRERQAGANRIWLSRFSWEPGRNFLRDFLAARLRNQGEFPTFGSDALPTGKRP
jgi:glycosyltransferase involved in cell wall biosynthesis